MPVSETDIMNETSEQRRSAILGVYYAGGRALPGLISCTPANFLFVFFLFLLIPVPQLFVLQVWYRSLM